MQHLPGVVRLVMNAYKATFDFEKPNVSVPVTTVCVLMCTSATKTKHEAVTQSTEVKPNIKQDYYYK